MKISEHGRNLITASLSATVALAALGGGMASPEASARERASICEFYNHGDFKRDRSGPCTIDESSGEVSIKLRNGSTMRFIPEQKRKGHFIDQDGNRLAVKHDNDWKRTYSWKNQRLIVQVADS